MIEHIHWLGHASFRIDGPTCIYIDPFRIPADCPPADVVLLTHEHYDHCSPADIDRILAPHTRIIGGEGVAEFLKEEYPITVLRHWQSVNVGRANIKAVPAYTYSNHHPAARGDVGFVIAMNFQDIYYAGDTDFIADLKRVRCDIAILLVSAKDGLMTMDNAKELVKTMRPKYVIPSHFGSTEGGTLLDAKALETALSELAKVVWLQATV